MNPFPEDLHFDNAGMIGGQRHIILTRSFRAATSLGVIVVPKGTISNGASIPRAAQSLVGDPFEEYLESAVVHDHLYSSANEHYTRAEADFILRELMWNQVDVARWKAIAFWWAVRVGGKWNYNGYEP